MFTESGDIELEDFARKTVYKIIEPNVAPPIPFPKIPKHYSKIASSV